MISMAKHECQTKVRVWVEGRVVAEKRLVRSKSELEVHKQSTCEGSCWNPQATHRVHELETLAGGMTRDPRDENGSEGGEEVTEEHR